MKKSPTKLALRQEMLRTLSAIDLRRAVGGDDSEIRGSDQSADKHCPVRGVVAPGG